MSDISRLLSKIRKATPVLAIVAACSCLAQVPGAPAFEVADVRPSAATDTRRGEKFLPGGRIEVLNATLKEMMVGTYGVQRDMILGGPRWLDSDRFDIVAKAPDPNTPIPTLLLMARTLLEDRFKLVVHREDKLMPAYTLALGKGGPRLRPAATIGGRQSCSNSVVDIGGSSILHRECHNMSMAELARQLTVNNYVDRQVVNATGLTGTYDFGFDYVRSSPGPGEPGRAADAPSTPDFPSGPTIFEAMTKLGLKLETGKQMLSVIVIDSVEKPGEN